MGVHELEGGGKRYIYTRHLWKLELIKIVGGR